MKHVFVFGSNQAGRHGKGAALYAKIHHGAEDRVGEGHMGTCYAIPTKDYNLNPRPLVDIEKSIQQFLGYANSHNIDNRFGLVFCVTPIGTGLAGYTKREIAALFKGKKKKYHLT